MLENTITIVHSVLKTDETISATQRREFLAYLKNGKPQQTPAGTSAGPSIIRRAEAARRLGRTTRSIDELCACGVLKKVTFPGRKRAGGILESSLADALSVS